MTTTSHSGVSASGAHAAVTRSPTRRPTRWTNFVASVEALRAVHLPELPPFCSGAVGYAGYDTVRYFEQLPNAPPDDRQVPDLAFAFYDRMVVFDHVNKTIVVVAMARLDRPGEQPNRPTRTPAAGRSPWSSNLAARSSRPATWSISGPAARSTLDLPLELHAGSNSRRPSSKCVEYIRAGDIFQVVLSQRLEVPLTAQPFDIYRTLRVVNPSPFMFYLRTPSVTLVGSSPEIMVRVVDGRGDRPAAGRHAPPRRRRKRKTAGWPRNCWPIPRSGPSTSCWSTWAATTWAASPAMAPSKSAT